MGCYNKLNFKLTGKEYTLIVQYIQKILSLDKCLVVADVSLIFAKLISLHILNQIYLVIFQINLQQFHQIAENNCEKLFNTRKQILNLYYIIHFFKKKRIRKERC